VRPEPEEPEPEEPERRTARAKRGTMSPRPPKWFLWERVFPSDYKCSREIEPDNWPVVRSDFPGYICSPMEKRVPTRTIGRGFENASGLGFWTSHPLHHAHMVNRAPARVPPSPTVDDRPFIVLTETKFSLRCIPVWIGTLLTGLGSKKKHM
jgi:hypothetical protein